MIVGNIDRTPCAFQNQINVDVVPIFYERDPALAISCEALSLFHTSPEVIDCTEPGSGVGFRLDDLLSLLFCFCCAFRCRDFSLSSCLFSSLLAPRTTVSVWKGKVPYTSLASFHCCNEWPLNCTWCKIAKMRK